MCWKGRPTGTIFSIRMKSWRSCSGFSTKQSDKDMYMNALLWGDAFILSETSACYRFHENNLTFHLSFPFIYNVVREKERIYRDAKKRLYNPNAFWCHHFRITYLFYKNGRASLKGKLKLLCWGLSHLHSNFILFKFVIKEILKALIGK